MRAVGCLGPCHNMATAPARYRNRHNIELASQLILFSEGKVAHS